MRSERMATREGARPADGGWTPPPSFGSSTTARAPWRAWARRYAAAAIAIALAAHPGTASSAQQVADTSWCGTGSEPAAPAFERTGAEIPAAPCPQRGACDDPVIRDATPVARVGMRLVVHIVRSSDGSCDLSPDAVRTAVQRLNAVYAATGTGFQFELTAIRVHVDDELAWLEPCDSADGCARARQGMNRLKFLYSESPESQCNVFLDCLETNRWGGQFGVGVYPWSSGALGRQGGIWLNALVLEQKPHLLPHEMGHALGLWHTFHGSAEVSGCSDPCAERVLDAGRDRVGDFASDTPATPATYFCDVPTFGQDCDGTDWGDTQPENYMNYGTPECASRFTPQQLRRMQCWAGARLTGWMTSSPLRSIGLSVGIAPSPSRAFVDLAFALPEAARVEVGVFDVLGRHVATPFAGVLGAGSHYVRWDGRDAAGARPPRGVYLARVRSERGSGSGTFILQ